MEQSPSYNDSQHPTHVCKLCKALYRLIQTPKAWFHHFSTFLIDSGFSSSHANSSLFIFSKDDNLIYLLLYVDDIVVTSNNSILLDDFISRLTKKFATKDMGSLSYFLGLEIHQHANGLFLS
jgi:hypothetical protein